MGRPTHQHEDIASKAVKYPTDVRRPTGCLWQSSLEERDLKSELLLRIKQAEEEAASRVEQAEEEAKRIVTDARRQAEERIQEGKARADEEAAAKIEAVKVELREAEAQKIAEGRRDAESLRDRFSSGLEGTTDRILDLFEERHL